jgi:hypothetical protein
MAREALIVYLDAGAKAALKQAAEAEDRELSPYCRRILERAARDLPSYLGGGLLPQK